MMIKAWFRRLFGARDMSPLTAEAIERQAKRMVILRGDGLDQKPQPLTTRQLQAREISQRFGADLRATTVDVRSLDEWLARIAVLEWEYSMRVPSELWMQAHNNAIDQIHLYRASLRNAVKQHHRRASRIQRGSLTTWRTA